MNEIPNLATPNDVLEHIPFQNAAGEIEVGEVKRVNELDMPFANEVSDSKPGEFILVKVPETGYYTRDGYDIAVPYEAIAEATGIDINVLKVGHGAYTINLEGHGFSRFCYAKYQGMEYTTGSFEALEGEEILLYANFGPTNRITVGNEVVAAGGPCTYSYMVHGDAVIHMEYSPASHAYITVNN